MAFKRTEVRPFGPEAIAEAAALIRAGSRSRCRPRRSTASPPTRPTREAVARIYEAKGRPSFNPLIVHVPDLAAAEALGGSTTRQHGAGGGALAGAADPGGAARPRAARSRAWSPPACRPSRCACRRTRHAALLEASGRPLAAPSANASGRISPTRAEHVLARSTAASRW
jgi:L-threonylcarbamoyladenylate synthase